MGMEEDAEIAGNVGAMQVEGNDIDIAASCEKAADTHIQNLVAENRKIAEHKKGKEYQDDLKHLGEDDCDTMTSTNETQDNADKNAEKYTIVSEVDTVLGTLLACKSLQEISNAKIRTRDSRQEVPLIPGLFEALHMKNRDEGTVNSAQRHQSLSARYNNAKKKEECKTSMSSADEKVLKNKSIQRGSVIKVQLDRCAVDEGRSNARSFVVLALSDKYYGKWCMNEKGSKIEWEENIKNVLIRLIVRELVLSKKHGILEFKPYHEINDFRKYHFCKDKLHILV